jgi:hypothetical protein
MGSFQPQATTTRLKMRRELVTSHLTPHVLSLLSPYRFRVFDLRTKHPQLGYSSLTQAVSYHHNSYVIYIFNHFQQLKCRRQTLLLFHVARAICVCLLSIVENILSLNTLSNSRPAGTQIDSVVSKTSSSKQRRLYDDWWQRNTKLVQIVRSGLF